jgi:hypothetical protein
LRSWFGVDSADSGFKCPLDDAGNAAGINAGPVGFGVQLAKDASPNIGGQ